MPSNDKHVFTREKEKDLNAKTQRRKDLFLPLSLYAFTFKFFYFYLDLLSGVRNLFAPLRLCVKKCFLFLFIFHVLSLQATVQVGLDRIYDPSYINLFKGKKIGLITNQTGISKEMKSSLDVFLAGEKKYHFNIVALFAPEHGLTGISHAWDKIFDGKIGKIPVFSLHGDTKRPTKKMLEHVDILVYDIQDIGSRSYTYISTLFFAMEEAAKAGIPVVVLDRPNPINGLVVDGPMLEDEWRSIVGYINVPYCHGMTVGELASLFNREYKIGCSLHVVPMSGWKRKMSFADTGLPWIPTSPHIPEASTVYYYPMTGILGELQLVNIGIGFTLPFKLVGAPWIDAEKFADHLNEQKLPGVYFHPFHYKPFYGTLANQECHGVMIFIKNHQKYLPVTTQYVIIGLLKSLYPDHFSAALIKSKHRETMFAKVNGTSSIYPILKDKQYIAWELREFHKKERLAFLKIRDQYLFDEYK